MRRILGLEVGWLILTRVGGSRGESGPCTPRYLDRQGLTACWREGLLAQAVLAGRTRGYRQHSQLERFRAQPDPVAAVGAYLEAVAREAADRGYRFDVTRIDRTGPPAGTAPAGAAVPRIPVTEG